MSTEVRRLADLITARTGEHLYAGVDSLGRHYVSGADDCSRSAAIRRLAAYALEVGVPLEEIYRR